ncbi:MAG: hypothetical protein KJ622_02390 [Alphaproteobacteria bacterium]|nr:hypothetical protein [Alphaproteobacteria bacterium]
MATFTIIIGSSNLIAADQGAKAKYIDLINSAYKTRSPEDFYRIGDFFGAHTGGPAAKMTEELASLGNDPSMNHRVIASHWYALSASLGSKQALIMLGAMHVAVRSCDDACQGFAPFNKNRSLALLLFAREIQLGGEKGKVGLHQVGSEKLNERAKRLAVDEDSWSKLRAEADKTIERLILDAPIESLATADVADSIIDNHVRQANAILSVIYQRIASIGNADFGPPAEPIQAALHDLLVSAVTAPNPARSLMKAWAGKITDADCDSSVCTVNGGLGKLRWLVVGDPACERLDKKPEPSWFNWTSAGASPRWNCRFGWRMDLQVDVRPLGLSNIPGDWRQGMLDGLSRAGTSDGEMVLELKDGKWASISGVLKGHEGEIAKW